jgi:hypothetical protein
MKRKKIAKMLLALLSPFILFGLYVVGVLIYGTMNDWKPEEKTSIEIKPPAAVNPSSTKDTLTLITWNVGYGGLGAEADFFYDGGSMVRSPKDMVEKYINGVSTFLKQNSAYDFILLQEVDLKSKRSYGTNEFERWAADLPNHSASIALNFKVPFVPVKYFDPIGKVKSGVASYLKCTPYEAVRHQYPGSFAWPSRVFNLDRCFLASRIKQPGGKDLVIINTHNSAYDDGTMKKQEMDYLKQFLLSEYQKGNYVIVGGDWNQCPPGFQWNKFGTPNDDSDTKISVDKDFMPAGWTWAYDDKIASNRNLRTAFEKGKTFTTVIDYFLLSPNVEMLEVHGQSMDFAYSDHQPVFLKCRIKR